jgi:uncharacterized membrane protein YjfL (UPF0719 family)
VEPYLAAAALLLEALVLVWIGKFAAGMALRRRLENEITLADNTAVALLIAGFYLGLLIAISGLLAGEGRDLGTDMAQIALHGAIAIVLLLISMLPWPIFFRVRIGKELFEQRSVGDGIIAGSALVATGMIYRGTLIGHGGLLPLIAFFVLGQLCLFAMSVVYQLITPYDVHKQISENKNLAVAFGFAGAILGFGVILSNAATGDFEGWGASLKEFALMALPVVLLYPIRIVVVNGLFLGFRNLNKEIEKDANVGAGVIEGLSYIGISLLVVELLS